MQSQLPFPRAPWVPRRQGFQKRDKDAHGDVEICSQDLAPEDVVADKAPQSSTRC